MIGFGYIKHPEKPKWWLNLVFYRVEPDEWVICLSEFRDEPRRAEMQASLGDLVPSELFAPFAQRQLKGGLSLKQFKRLIEESYPDTKFEWQENG